MKVTFGIYFGKVGQAPWALALNRYCEESVSLLLKESSLHLKVMCVKEQTLSWRMGYIFSIEQHSRRSCPRLIANLPSCVLVPPHRLTWLLLL